MTEQLIQSFLQDLSNLTKRQAFNTKIQQFESVFYNKALEQLNNQLPIELRINQKIPSQHTYNKFPQSHFENKQLNFTKTNKLEKLQIQREIFSPFVSYKDNFMDIHANTKSLQKSNKYTLTQTTTNFAHFTKQNKQSKFEGEQKATFPTIVFQGKKQHPLNNFSRFEERKHNFTESMSKLGGLNDSLSRLGIESVVDKKRKTIEESFKRYSSFTANDFGKSNTKNTILEPPKIEVKPVIINPFVKVPLKYRD